MWDLTRDTLTLVWRNKLFADPATAYRQAFTGILGAAFAFVMLVNLQVPLWLAATIAGFTGGYAMPYLFEHIKFI